VHKYFPDFIFQVKQKNGDRVTYMWEVKPLKQTAPPQGKRKTKRYISECATYAVNLAKWEAAKRFCDGNNWKFDIITEEDIFKRG
jgi:uncharacterized membrane protein